MPQLWKVFYSKRPIEAPRKSPRHQATLPSVPGQRRTPLNTYSRVPSHLPEGPSDPKHPERHTGLSLGPSVAPAIRVQSSGGTREGESRKRSYGARVDGRGGLLETSSTWRILSTSPFRNDVSISNCSITMLLDAAMKRSARKVVRIARGQSSPGCPPCGSACPRTPQSRPM